MQGMGCSVLWFLETSEEGVSGRGISGRETGCGRGSQGGGWSSHGVTGVGLRRKVCVCWSQLFVLVIVKYHHLEYLLWHSKYSLCTYLCLRFPTHCEDFHC